MTLLKKLFRLSVKLNLFIKLVLFYLPLLFNCLLPQDNFWQRTNGPYGCTINDLAIGPEGSIYAATDGSGIYRSDDGGNSWININEGLPGKNILIVAVNDSGHVFIGIDHDAPEGDIIYRSFDLGKTWSYLTHYGSDLSDMVIDKNSNIYISDKQNSIIKSIDNGNSWIELEFEGTNTPIYVYQMAINDSGIYAASTATIIEKMITQTEVNEFIPHDGIFFSKDEGLSWKKLLSGPFSSVSCGNSGFVIGGHILSDEFYLSEDFGLNWVYNSDLYDVRSFLLYNNTTIYAACSNGLFRSEDRGLNWSGIVDVSGIRINNVAKDLNNCIFTGTSSNIFKSEDAGQSWQIKNEGIYNPAVYALISHKDGRVIAGGYKGGIYITYDKGVHWEVRNQQDMSQYSVYSLAFNSKSRLFVGTSQPMPRGNLFYSDDYGLSWQTTPIYELHLMFEEIWAMTVDQDNILYLGLNGDGILYSDNDGDSLKSTNLYGGIIRSMTTSKTGEVLAGVLGNGIVFSPDKGETWVKRNNGLDDPNVYAITPVEESVIYIGTGKGLFKTTDNGNLWNKVDIGIPEAAVSSIVGNKNALYVATFEKGVFYSSDNGINWQTVNEGLLESLVWSMTIDSDGYLYAGTNNGVFRSMEPVTSIEYSSTPKMTDSFILYQNYPNPFNHSTKISFSITIKSYVRLEIYNPQGQIIKTLIKDHLPSGYHEIIWNSTNNKGVKVPSGLYFARLKINNRSDVKKMILLQ